jgi:hypothetical protein
MLLPRKTEGGKWCSGVAREVLALVQQLRHKTDYAVIIQLNQMHYDQHSLESWLQSSTRFELKFGLSASLP